MFVCSYTVEEGAVFIFLGGVNFPRGNTTYDCADTLIVPCLSDKVS